MKESVLSPWLFSLERKLEGIETMVAEKLDPKEIVSFEELLMSNVVEQEALINLLEKKGIITKTELLEEIKRLRGKRRRFRMKWPW